MLEFRTIGLSDRLWIKELLGYSDFRGCEYCFANNMAWRRMYSTKITRYKDFYISCSESGKGIYFTFPAGRGDHGEVFSLMKEYSEKRGFPLVIGSVTPAQFSLFEELFPKDSYTVSADEDGWDYVYNSSDLAELKGKKYHGKRNHLKKLPEDCVFTPMTEKDFDDCIAYAARSYNRENAYDEYSKVCEQFAINTFFENFAELGLSGGVLRQGGRLIAFTVGERINSDTLGVHIEKADADIDGAYPAINQGFAASAGKGFLYINREEDLGIEGLRKAKRSYHPAFMIEKHTVTFK